MKGTREFVAVLLFALAGPAAGDCSVSVTPTNFGIYYPTATSESSGDVAINCFSGIPYQIKLDAGMNSSNNYFPRKMLSLSGTGTLAYNLYTTPDLTSVWGDGTSGTFIGGGTGTGYTEFHKIYGQIPADQNVADGVYSDAVSVLLEW